MTTNDETRAFLARAHERNKAALDRLGEGPAPSLLDWLRWQIETRKTLAEAACGKSWTHDVYLVQVSGNGGYEQARLYEPDDGEVLISYRYGEQGLTEDDLAHIAFNDPRQVIADCEADMALLELHSHRVWDVCRGCGLKAPCWTARTFAARYRHRPGYQPSWAPEGATP